MDYEEFKTQLVELLKTNRAVAYAAECAREIENGKLLPKHEASRPVPIGMIRHIYRVRARWVKRQRYPVYGMDEMVANLENTDSELVDIQTVEGERYGFTVFTDEKCETLFGIIAIDESTDWRGRPLPDLKNWTDEK